MIGPKGVLVRMEPNRCHPIAVDRFIVARRIPPKNSRGERRPAIIIETLDGKIDFFAERLAAGADEMNSAAQKLWPSWSKPAPIARADRQQRQDVESPRKMLRAAFWFGGSMLALFAGFAGIIILGDHSPMAPAVSLFVLVGFLLVAGSTVNLIYWFFRFKLRYRCPQCGGKCSRVDEALPALIITAPRVTSNGTPASSNAKSSAANRFDRTRTRASGSAGRELGLRLTLSLDHPPSARRRQSEIRNGRHRDRPARDCRAAVRDLTLGRGHTAVSPAKLTPNAGSNSRVRHSRSFPCSASGRGPRTRRSPRRPSRSSSRDLAIRRASGISHRCRVMPLGDFERQVLRIIAANRNPESYVAGATVLHQSPDSPRASRDVDAFTTRRRAWRPPSPRIAQLCGERGSSWKSTRGGIDFSPGSSHTRGIRYED